MIASDAFEPLGKTMQRDPTEWRLGEGHHLQEGSNHDGDL
jgi:hypothetical protein